MIFGLILAANIKVSTGHHMQDGGRSERIRESLIHILAEIRIGNCRSDVPLKKMGIAIVSTEQELDAFEFDFILRTESWQEYCWIFDRLYTEAILDDPNCDKFELAKSTFTLILNTDLRGKAAGHNATEVLESIVLTML